MKISFKDYNLKINNNVLLENINLDFSKGLNVILGKNGIGKTSFAKSILGLISYDGDIYFDKINLNSLNLPERSKIIYYSYQHPPEIKGLKIKNYLELLKKNYNNNINILELFDNLGLSKELLTRDFNVNLSGGERKRLELAQIYIINPKVIIFDEIDSGVDFYSLPFLADSIYELSKEKIVFLITHSKEFLNYFKSKTIYELKNKKLERV